MDDVFLGEIRYVAFNFAPQGWAVCAGQTLPIAQNTALFSLLGVTYGGNGTTTFQLPDLQGRVAVGKGQGPGLSNYDLGQQGGSESVTLNVAQLPPHGHGVVAATTNASLEDPASGVYAKFKVKGAALYAPTAGGFAAADTIGMAGGNQPHENRAPGIALTAIIATQGIYPQRP